MHIAQMTAVDVWTLCQDISYIALAVCIVVPQIASGGVWVAVYIKITTC